MIMYFVFPVVVSYVSDLPDHDIMKDCLVGHYCPNGTGRDLKPCPSGTYSNTKGLARAKECTPCDGGKVCRGTNLTAPNDVCAPGYFCSSGIDSTTPYMTNLTQCPLLEFPIIPYGGPCPIGTYCEQGSPFYKGMLARLSNNNYGNDALVRSFSVRNTRDYWENTRKVLNQI